MSAIERATAEAVEAARQSERYAELLAVVAAVQSAQTAVQPHQGCACQHTAPQQSRRSAVEVATIAVAVCGCVGVAVAALLAVALAAVGIAVSAVVCLFVIREIRKGSK